MSKKNKKSVELIPKVILDEDMLVELNRHYAARLGDEVLGRECFSDPKMDSHVCNPHALLPGDVECKHCGHVIGRPCTVTCDVHHFCLAVYGYRLGVGVTPRMRKIMKAVKHNLTSLPYTDLYQLVVERHALQDDKPVSMDAGESLKDEVQMELSGVEDVVSSTGDSPLHALIMDDAGFELVTVREGAAIYGCTYVMLYSYVQKGLLKKYKKGTAIYLRKLDVEALKGSKLPKDTSNG